MSLKITGLFTAMVLMTTGAFSQVKGGPDKNIETILGTWKVQKIMSGKTEVAKNPTSGQWIEFRSDGKYVNHAAAIDSGSYRLNENHSTLYLESANKGSNGESKVIEWVISLQDDALTMQQKNDDKKNPRKDKMNYVYVRIGEGSKTLND